MNTLHKVGTPEIRRFPIDAIINAVNESMLGQVHLPNSLTPGQVLAASEASSPFGHVLHTCIPSWNHVDSSQEQLLRKCYRDALGEARILGCQAVAVPILGSDAGGFPLALALQIAEEEIRTFLSTQPGMDVYLLIRQKQLDAYNRTLNTHQRIQAYIAQRMEEAAPQPSSPMADLQLDGDVFAELSMAPSENAAPSASVWDPDWEPDFWEDDDHSRRYRRQSMPRPKAQARRPSFLSSLFDLLTSRNLPVREEDSWKRDLDESFPEMLMRLIDEKGMSDAQCYNKAGVDRRVFSRIRSGQDSAGRPYQPSKPTVLAFAIALELPLSTTNELLRKAGYALSPCYQFDIIVEYFIRNKIYDLYEVNLALYEFDQPLLGSKTVS